MTAERRPRPSLWWLAAGILGVVGLAWLAGSTGGTTAPEQPIASSLPSSPDEDELPGPDGIVEAEAFWWAMGAGDADTVLAALDPEAGLPLTHYAEFAIAFEARLQPEACRWIADDTVRCGLRSGNARLVDLYWTHTETTEYVTSASVTFGSEGIVAFQLPGLINSAAARLATHAQAGGSLPGDCDRINYDAVDLPPFNTRIAQTGDCARALLEYLDDALGAEG